MVTLQNPNKEFLEERIIHLEVLASCIRMYAKTHNKTFYDYAKEISGFIQKTKEYFDWKAEERKRNPQRFRSILRFTHEGERDL